MPNPKNSNDAVGYFIGRLIGFGLRKAAERYGGTLTESGFRVFEKKFLPKEAPNLLEMSSDEMIGLLQREDAGKLIMRWRRKQERKSNNFYRGFALTECILCDMDEETAVDLFIKDTGRTVLAKKALNRFPILLAGRTDENSLIFLEELETAGTVNNVLAIYEENHEFIEQNSLQDNLF